MSWPGPGNVAVGTPGCPGLRPRCPQVRGRRAAGELPDARRSSRKPRSGSSGDWTPESRCWRWTPTSRPWSRSRQTVASSAPKPDPLHRCSRLAPSPCTACVATPPGSARPYSARFARVAIKGELIAIHPSAVEVGGVPALPSLTDHVGVVDLAVIAVPARHAEAALADAGDADVPAAVVISSGFGEIGEAGAEMQQQLADSGQAAGDAPGGSELPRTRLQRSGRSPERHLQRFGARIRWPGGGQPVRRSGDRSHGPRRSYRPRRPLLRLARQQGGRVQQ